MRRWLLLVYVIVCLCSNGGLQHDLATEGIIKCMLTGSSRVPTDYWNLKSSGREHGMHSEIEKISSGLNVHTP